MSAEPIHLSNSTPFDLIAEDAQQWIDEARNWADGEPVTTQAQADDVSRLIDALRKSGDAAEAQRKVEVKPFDDGKAAVQEKYAPLFADAKNKNPGAIHKAIAALKATLQPYLTKLDEEKREKARKAQAEAEAATRAAQEAARAANAASMEEQEKAEEAIRAAEAAQRAAKVAANDRAHATGGTRAMGLRTVWRAEITDARAALAHYYRINPDAFLPLVQKLADDDKSAGKRDGIPGVRVYSEQVL